MRLLPTIALCAIVALVLGVAPPLSFAQDAVTADAAHHKVEFENDQVRVVRYYLDPHDKTPVHSHPNGVQIVLTDYNSRITTPDGKTTDVHAKAGQVVWRNPTTHTVENIGDSRIEGILVEPKNKGAASPLAEEEDPARVAPQQYKVEFENDQVRVLRFHYGPNEKSAMHQHPNNVRVWLTDVNARILTPDGKASPSEGKAGEVRWQTATEHSVQNVGSQPYEGILVEIKAADTTASQ
jgi:quercetin dioxygenase-like cupin family protein